MGRGSENYYLDLTGYFIANRVKRRDKPLTQIGEETGNGLSAPAGVAIEIDLPGEPAGQWIGGGCLDIGLHGEVFPEELQPLMLGYHPATGQPLVQNAGAPNRVPGWDFTFSAPKSVSVAWSQADEELRYQIEDAHNQSVVAAIELAEHHLSYSRIGKAGAGHVPVKLIVAAFGHGTSRNEDAQLHTHCLVLNVTVDRLGATRALYSRPFFVNRNVLGAYYRAELAHRLSEMGFQVRKHGTSFEIVGVPQDLLIACSTRRVEILAYLNEQGRSGAVAAAVATLKTRQTKAELPPRAELFERWQDFNRDFGFDEVRAIMDPERPKRPGTIQQALDAAIARLAAEESHFTKTDFLAAALQEAPMRGLNALTLLHEAHDFLERSSVVRSVTNSTVVARPPQAHDLFDLGSHQGHQRFTTREVLEEEQALLQTVESLKDKKGAVVPDQLVEMAIDDRLKYTSAAPPAQAPPTRTPTACCSDS